MAYRGITRIILYKPGFVCCIDDKGHQAPQLQGSRIIKKIKEHFAPDSVQWFIVDKPVSFKEWSEYGEKLSKTRQKVKQST